MNGLSVYAMFDMIVQVHEMKKKKKIDENKKNEILCKKTPIFEEKKNKIKD